MDTQGSHNIVPARELTPDPETKERYMPLTREEYAILHRMTAEERREWLRKNVPTAERLARHLGSIGCHAMANRARRGWYSDYESEHPMPKNLLVQELHDIDTPATAELAKLVIAGEYDDTKEESDAWAERQFGEIGDVLDRLGLREAKPKGDGFDEERRARAEAKRARKEGENG